MRVQIPIEQPKKWSPAQPALYECHITTRFDDEICDEAVSNFGIRVLALDPVHGLQIMVRQLSFEEPVYIMIMA